MSDERDLLAGAALGALSPADREHVTALIAGDGRHDHELMPDGDGVIDDAFQVCREFLVTDMRGRSTQTNSVKMTFDIRG